MYTEKSDRPTPAKVRRSAGIHSFFDRRCRRIRRPTSRYSRAIATICRKLDDILQLLTQLYSCSRNYLQSQPLRESINLDSYFQSKKLNNKLLKQMEDSIIIASSSFPSWSSWLTHSYRFFYPFETRQLYFRTTSFGTSRSIVLLQERREEMIRTIRQSQHGRLRWSNENFLCGRIAARDPFRTLEDRSSHAGRPGERLA